MFRIYELRVTVASDIEDGKPVYSADEAVRHVQELLNAKCELDPGEVALVAERDED